VDICPNSKEVLEKAGILTVEEYIQRRRDTILPYARSTNTYGRCKNAKKQCSNLRWWEVNYYSSNDAAERGPGCKWVLTACTPPAITRRAKSSFVCMCL
jgi:hypothetical protein